MKAKRSIWTSITGGLTSAAPILLACCKSGACVSACASPIASLFGISSAALVSSTWIGVIEPILIAVSAVSFTVSYYSIYVIPRFATCGPADCACEPTASEKRKNRIAKFVFWFGLFVSIGFLSYFEYRKYQETNVPVECGTEYAPGSCEGKSQECCPDGDSTNCAK